MIFYCLLSSNSTCQAIMSSDFSFCNGDYWGSLINYESRSYIFIGQATITSCSKICTNSFSTIEKHQDRLNDIEDILE